MISFEGLSLMLLNFLRIPPGAAVRKSYGAKGNLNESEIALSDDIINSMVDITVDDVCIGNSPFYLKYDDSIDQKKLEGFEVIQEQLNNIAKWAAKDLLKRGVSVYDVSRYKENGKFVILPHLDEVQVFLNKYGETVITDMEGNILPQEETLAFVNFDKESMTPIDDSVTLKEDEDTECVISVRPVPIQLKNISSVSRDLFLTKKSILRYRAQLSRIVRFVSVDVGVSQGNKQQEVVDTISEAINADSNSLMQTTDQLSSYDDNIPVLPSRKGAGKPELVTDIPNANLSELVDLDHLQGDLALVMRFPKTYADFSQTLGDTAASTIRGDIRYSRLVDYARSKIEDTVNDFMLLCVPEDVEKYHITYKLTQYPQPEDEDVIDAISSYKDFLSETVELVLEHSNTKYLADQKIKMLEDLLGDAANIASIQAFIQDLKETVDSYKFENDEDLNDDLDTPEDKASEFDLGGEGPSSEESPEESTEEPSQEEGE